MNYIKWIRLSRIPHSEYPFNIPAVRHLKNTGGISLDKPVTFLVGENGTSKSSLTEAPSEGVDTYVPIDAEAIPGMIIGEATITETPLGISIRYMETVTDEEALYNIKKVKFDGLVYGQGSSVLEDDGNWWFNVSGCTGDVGDTLVARYYVWDDQLVGTIEFVKK